MEANSKWGFAPGFDGPAELRALLEILFRSSPLGLAVFRGDGACMAIGGDAGRCIGGPIDTILCQDFRELSSWRGNGMLEAAERALETGELQSQEFRGTSTFGRGFWFDARFHRFDAASERYLLLQFLDVSAEREAELERTRRVDEAMRESERRFQILAERVDQVFWMSTPGIAEMLYVSPAYERIFGRSCSSLYEHPQSFLEAIHPADQERVAAGVAEHANGEWDHEYRILQPDGEVRHIRDRGTALHGSDGQLAGMCGTACDITDLKQIEQELRGTVRALARARRDLEQFAYAAADDMQVPLDELRGRLAALREAGGVDGSAAGLVERLDLPVERLGTMLSDVMEYVGLTDSPDPPASRDLGQCVRMALSSLATAIEDQGAEVDVGDLPSLPADGQQMVRLFQLLLANALQHGACDPTRVQVDAVREEEAWIVRIHDHGRGIEPEHCESIFRMFRRLPVDDGGHGTGAGLAIARRIVELHGGRIWVESVPGEGATFLFALPDSPVQQTRGTG